MHENRLNAAIKIILNPEEYKICEGCGSIVVITTIICPSCHSYRFNEKVEDIVNQAELLGGSEQKSVTKDDLF